MNKKIYKAIYSNLRKIRNVWADCFSGSSTTIYPLASSASFTAIRKTLKRAGIKAPAKMAIILVDHFNSPEFDRGY